MVDQQTPTDVPITRRKVGPFRVLDIGTVVVILLVLGVIALVAHLREPTPADRDGAAGGADRDGRAAAATMATEVAEAQVLGLTTLDRKDIEGQLADLKARVTDDYRADFATQLATFTQVALSYDGLSTGKITSSKIERIDDEQAEVAVTATTSTTRRKTPTVERTYAFTVTLDHQGDDWLVSDLTLVS